MRRPSRPARTAPEERASTWAVSPDDMVGMQPRRPYAAAFVVAWFLASWLATGAAAGAAPVLTLRDATWGERLC